jgi:hypothetical protein
MSDYVTYKHPYVRLCYIKHTLTPIMWLMVSQNAMAYNMCNVGVYLDIHYHIYNSCSETLFVVCELAKDDKCGQK